MEDNQSFDLMESIFGNITLANVEAEGLGQSRRGSKLGQAVQTEKLGQLRRGSELSQASGLGQLRRDSELGQVNVQTHVLGQQLSRRGSELSQSAPVPKQRHEVHSNGVPILEKDPEFHASLFGVTNEEVRLGQQLDLNALTRRSSTTTNKSEQHELASVKSESTVKDEHHDLASLKSESTLKSRRESTISRKSEPIYDDVHSVHSVHSVHYVHEPNEVLEEVVEVQNLPPAAPKIEADRISLSGKIPNRSTSKDQLIAELRTRHCTDLDYDNGTLTTSKTSELGNEYELYSTPMPGSEGTEVNEQTDDSGTETEEVLPVNRTKYLFDSKNPYHVEHFKQPDSFQQELGQKITTYQREAPAELQQIHASNTLRSNASEKSAASDFVVSNFENNTQELVRAEVGSEIKLQDLKQMFESPPTTLNGKLVADSHHLHEANKPSYKQFIGKKSPETRVLRTGSIVTLNNFTNDPAEFNKMPTLDEESENYRESQQYFQHRQSPTKQIPVEKVLVERQHLTNGNLHQHFNGHQYQTPIETGKSVVIRPVERTHAPNVIHRHEHSKSSVQSRNSTGLSYRNYIQNDSQHHEHSKVNGHQGPESPIESRRSSIIRPAERTHVPNSTVIHHEHPVEHVNDSRRSSVLSYKNYNPNESHRSNLIYHEHPIQHVNDSRRSTVIHHEHPIQHVNDSRRSTLVQHHEHPIQNVNDSRRSTLVQHHEHPIQHVNDSRRSTLVQHHENSKTPNESRRSTLIQHHEHPVENHNNSRRSTLVQHHEHPIEHENHNNSRRSTLVHHHEQPIEHENHNNSRRSTLVHHEHSKTPNESRRSTLVHHHEHPIEHEIHNESRRSTLVHHHENGKAPNESRRSTLIHHHENGKTPNESRRSTLVHHHEHPVEHENHNESRRSTLIHHHEHPVEHESHNESRRSSIVEKSANHLDSNNNSENVKFPHISQLCTIFEENHQLHQKSKRFIAPDPNSQDKHVESFLDLEKYHVPLLSRVVISDATAHGLGTRSPGSIAALHKSILEGNPNIRTMTPIEYEEHIYEEIPHKEEPVVVEVKKRRKPKTLAAFYDRWGQSPIPSEI